MVGLSSPQWFPSPELPTAAWQRPQPHTNGYVLSGSGGQGLCVCPLLPSRAMARARAGAGEAAVPDPSPGLKPATLIRFSFLLSTLGYSLVSFSLVDLELSHRFVINSGFADQSLYFWPVSCLAAAVFISLSDLNNVKTCLKSISTA